MLELFIKLTTTPFFRMLHIVEQVSWPDLYLIYLEHCYHDELDTKDRELSIGRYHGDMTKVLTQNIGLYNINRKIRDEENSNSYGQKRNYYQRR